MLPDNVDLFADSQTNPPGFGSGTGSRGRREDKGQGLRTKDDIERERGRYGIDIGRRL
jgi:small subunit ribosomal protein S5